MGGVLCKEQLSGFCKTIEDGKSQNNSGLPWHSEVEVDWNGCRRFPALPPPGNHPRLFFTAEEIPGVLARFTHTEIGDELKSVLTNVKKAFLKQFYAKLEDLSKEEVEKPSKATIEQFFTPDEIRNVGFLGTYVSGVLDDDAELIQKARNSVLFYAKVILESKNLSETEGFDEKPFNVWKSERWDLHIGWMFGGSSYALVYDLMFNILNEGERILIRKAITTAVKGRRSWGMDWPGRRIQSNWAAYHGDLLSLCAVVEGEEGFDQEVYNSFSELMVNFLDYAVYDSGHTVEDFYALNLGMREGSISFLVMARRGHNIFNHPRKSLQSAIVVNAHYIAPELT
ncbi:Chondroitin AC/alginate lyase [Gracilaria domingensis]|nr:Chondroitin AC/alginate lyase [Gracilaria domingensis]